MQNTLNRFLLIGLTLLLAACAQTPNVDYTNYRASKPASILVLPPLNNTPDVRATYSFLSTVTMPLAESGYYVFPVALVDQTFKENGLQNPGEIHQASLPRIRKIFGADAVLYITIKDYGASFQVINSKVMVSASAKLVDARTGDLLWTGEATASNDEGGNSSSSSLAGMLLTAVIKQVAGSIGDQGHNVSKITSQRLLYARPNGLLYGPRSPEYGKN